MRHFSLRKPTSPCPHGARIELDDPAASFRAGDPIRGRLHLSGGDGAQPRSVAVELQVAASGADVSSIGVAAAVGIPLVPLAPGHAQTHPFTLVAPPLPPPHAGTLFRSEIRLAAVIDMPDATPNELVPHGRAFPAATLPIVIQTPHPVVARTERSTGRVVRLGRVGFPIGVIIFVLGVLSAGLAIGLPMWSETSLAVPITAGSCAVMFLLVGGAFIAMTFGNWRAENVIGIPSVAIETRQDPTAPVLHVSATVRRPNVARGVAKLSVRESVSLPDTSEGGWGKDHVVTTLAFELVPGAPGHWSVEIPARALDALPLPFDLYGNKIRWMLDLSLFAHSGREWKTFAILEAFRGEPWQPRVTFSWT